MNRKEQVLALLLKTFPAGSSLALMPDSLELESLSGDDRFENYQAILHWRDGVPQRVRVPGDISLDEFWGGRELKDAPSWQKWVAVMKQDGAGSPNLRMNDPDFSSRAAIAKQSRKLTFGRPLYVLYFELVNPKPT